MIEITANFLNLIFKNWGAIVVAVSILFGASQLYFKQKSTIEYLKESVGKHEGDIVYLKGRINTFDVINTQLVDIKEDMKDLKEQINEIKSILMRDKK